MSDLASTVKLISEVGLVGVMALALLLFYKLLDKYGGAFLKAQEGQSASQAAQASSIAALAAAVREGQNDQRDVLIAVRVLADRIDTQKGYLESIDRTLREKGVVVE